MAHKLNHRLPGTPANASPYVQDPCLPWRALLPEAADDTLEAFALQALEQHLDGCSGCRAELEDARRGLGWLTLLKDEVPAPPDAMLAGILARTTGAAEVGVFLPEQPAYIPVSEEEPAGTWQTTLRWMRGEPGTWSGVLQPHFAMTGAMAFLSVCLTINLLSDSLALHRTGPAGIERSVADTEATVVRSLHGLRVVYQVETRVNELRGEAGHAGTPSRSQ